MSKKTFAIVITSIGNGDVLGDYCRQAETEQVKDSLNIIVIPDRKSPEALYKKCDSLLSAGFNIACPSLTDQRDYLRRFEGLHDIIAYDSDNRRNIGFLMALGKGCEVLISLDDDNYCIPGERVFNEYAIVTNDKETAICAHSSIGWFNACDMLEIEPEVKLFPRGFPYNRRIQENKISYTQDSSIIRLNVGLWLDELDLDAITRLTVIARSKKLKTEPVVLSQETWAPINTQNTSLAREAIIAYYFFPMGHPMISLTIDRYGDIFSGFFCQACMKHLGHSLRIGTPMTFHIRNAHNYLEDLTKELACIWMLEDITEWLRELKLQGNTYTQAYLSLAQALDDQAERFKGAIWTDESRKYLHYATKCMRLWAGACQQIGA